MKAVVLLLVQLAALHGVGHAVPIGAVPEAVNPKSIRNGSSWDHRQTRKEYEHQSNAKTRVARKGRLQGKDVKSDGYDEIADGFKDFVRKSTTEYKENTKQSSKGGIGGLTNDDWSVFTEESTEDWISGKEETTVADKDFTNGVTEEVDQRTTHNPEATDGFSDEGVVGEITEELDEFTKESTEDSMPRVDVTTADYEDFTDGLNEKLDQSTTEYPEQTSEFSYAGVEEKNTVNSIKFPEGSTEVGKSGVEVNTEDYGDITDGVTDEFDQNTTEHGEQTHELSDGGFGGGTTDDSDEYTEKSTEDWFTGEKLNTEANSDLTDEVTDEYDQHTTNYPEPTDEFSDGEFGGDTSYDSGEFTEESTEGWLPRVKFTTETNQDFTEGDTDEVDQRTTEKQESTDNYSNEGVGGESTDESGKFTEEQTEKWLPGEVTTEAYDDLTHGVTEGFGQSTTEYPEDTYELSDGGFGGSTSEDSGKFTEGSTENWLTGVDVTAEHFDEFTDGVTEEFGQSTTEYPEHTYEYSDGGFGGSTSEDSGEFTEGSTEDWLTGVDVTTEHFDDMTDGVTEEFGRSTTEYSEHTDELSDGAFGGATTEDSVESTQERTEDWFSGEEMTTVTDGDFTHGVTEEFGQSTTEYPEHTDELSDGGFGGATTEDSGEFWEGSTEDWFSGEEMTTVTDGDFAHGVTEEFGQSTTEYVEHTYDFSDQGLGVGTTDDSVKSTEFSTGDLFSGEEVTTEAYGDFADGVTDEFDQNTTEHGEQTHVLSDGLVEVRTTDDSGEYTEVSSEGLLPGLKLTTEAYEDFTEGVTNEVDRRTTDSQEATDNYSNAGVGGETTVESGKFTEETTENWLSGEEVTTEAYDDLTHEVTEVFDQNMTEYIKHTSELSDGRIGGGTTDDSGKSTQVTTEDWFSREEVTTEAFDVFTVGVTDDVDVSTTEYPERTDEFTDDLSVAGSDNISGMYTNLTTVGIAVEHLASLGDVDQLLPRNVGA